MAETIELLPKNVKVRVKLNRVSARVQKPLIPAEVSLGDVPVVIVPGNIGPEGPKGPSGPQGVPGAPGAGPSWWFGQGVPNAVPGSRPGDRYLDEDTGDVYLLGD